MAACCGELHTKINTLLSINFQQLNAKNKYKTSWINLFSGTFGSTGKFISPNGGIL